MFINKFKYIKGQTALFTVTMISIAAVSVTYFAASRNVANKKMLTGVNFKKQAYEALDIVAKQLSQAYAEKSCDPGLFYSSNMMSMTTATLLNAHALTSSITFRGRLIPIPASSTYTSPYQSPYDQPGVLYYPVYIQKVYTIERTDIDPGAVTTKRDILFPDPAGTAPMSVVPISRARSPSAGVYFAANQGNLPLGIRDMSVELSVVYPPLNSGNRLLDVPRNTISQTVVLVNSCVSGGTGSSNRYYLPTDTSYTSFLNGGKGCRKQNVDSAWGPWTPYYPYGSNVGSLNFSYDPTNATVGTSGVSETVMDSNSLERLKRYIQEGTHEYGPLTSDTVDFFNCADINRDGLVNDMDVGVMEKHLSGYSYHTFPPVYPEYRGGADNSHTLQNY